METSLYNILEKGVIMHKLKVVIAMRVIYPLFKIIPVNQKLIFFEASQGRYTSNPKYLYQQLLTDSRFKQFTVIWALTDQSKQLTNSKVVKIYSLQYLYYLATAGILVNDNMWHPAMKKRSKQRFIQTWHGTPLKKIASDTNVPSNDQTQIKSNLQYTTTNANLFDVMIASSKYTEQQFKSAFKYSGQVLRCGTPRVDYLIKNRNYRSTNYSKFDHVVLIAPSFRKSLRGIDQYKYFYEGFKINQLATLFPNYCFLLKLHNYAYVENHGQSKNIIDVSDVEDISALYLDADILLTDYSSTLFDFSVLNRTTIIFPFDFDFSEQKIIIDDEPLYLELPNDKLPGTVVTTFELLVDQLNNPILDQATNYTEYERGTSSQQILDWITAHQEVIDDN